jgi:hypothetical protein
MRDSAAEMERLQEEIHRLKVRLCDANKAKSKYHMDLKETKRLLRKFKHCSNSLLTEKQDEKPASVIDGIHSALDK